MDLEECLNHFAETDNTVFEIVEAYDYETPLAGYQMVVVTSEEYYFLDLEGYRVSPHDLTWVALEQSHDWEPK